MQHEPAVDLALDRFDLLLVVRRAERYRDERLSFASRKHRRAVDARQHADFRPNRPNLVELAPVQSHTSLEDFLAQDFFLELLEDRLGFDLALHFALGNRADEVGEHLIDGAVVLQLVLDAHGVAERNHHLFFHFPVERGVVFLFRDRALRLAGFLRERVDRLDNALDGGVTGLQRLNHFLFRQFFRARFDHHEALAGARDD